MTSITTRISIAISAILLLSHNNNMMLTSAFTTRMAPRVNTALRALSSTDTSQRISTKLEELWNEQVHNELFASQFYLAASIWCKNKEFEGMSSYMRKESDEERGHAMGFIDFALKKNIPLQLKEVDAPPNSWKNVQELWEDMLKLEQTEHQIPL